MTEAAIASAELREVLEGRLTQNGMTYPLAPYLDGDALHRYIKMKRMYPKILERDRTHGNAELPPVFEASAYCQRLIEVNGSVEARKAVAAGCLEILSYMTGLTHRKVDFSSVQMLQRVLNDVRREGYLCTFAGDTNAGKTNLGLLLAELALRDNTDMVLATNVKSVRWHDPLLQERTIFVETRSEVEAVCAEHQDVFAVLDEMSTQANAQTKNYEVNSEFYPMITFKSKYGLRLVIIGHRESGHDIAPAIREHSTYFVTSDRIEHDLEPDEYRAEFFDGIEDGEPVDLQYPLHPVPVVGANYDPDETATFDIAS